MEPYGRSSTCRATLGTEYTECNTEEATLYFAGISLIEPCGVCLFVCVRQGIDRWEFTGAYDERAKRVGPDAPIPEAFSPWQYEK